MFVKNEKGILVRLEDIQSVESYTEEEITTMLNLARNQRQYDCIIDRLFFQRSREGNRQCKNRHEHSFLTARALENKEKKEIKDNIILNNAKSN